MSTRCSCLRILPDEPILRIPSQPVGQRERQDRHTGIFQVTACSAKPPAKVSKYASTAGNPNDPSASICIRIVDRMEVEHVGDPGDIIRCLDRFHSSVNLSYDCCGLAGSGPESPTDRNFESVSNLARVWPAYRCLYNSADAISSDPDSNPNLRSHHHRRHWLA